MVERVHGTINDMLRCSDALYWYESLPAISWALRAGYHQALQRSPGEVIFGTLRSIQRLIQLLFGTPTIRTSKNVV
jgi:hypothetical protein